MFVFLSPESKENQANNSTRESEINAKDLTRSSQAGTTKKPGVGPSVITPVTPEEFDTIPKYMKGRLSAEKINEAIDELNRALSEKYKLLRQPVTKLTDDMQRRVRVCPPLVGHPCKK